MNDNKEISVTDFMNALDDADKIQKKKDFQTLDTSEVIFPIENLSENIQDEIIKELDEKKINEENKINIDNIEINNVVGVIPLEPVVVMVSIGEESKLGDLKTIGIPGFINANTENFFLLDGRIPESKTLLNEIKKYIQNRG